MNSQHIKSVSTDGRSKKRLTFASNRKRSKLASADTYRTFHGRRVGLGTSAAIREEQVHNARPRKKQKSHTQETVALGKHDADRRTSGLDTDSDDDTSETNFSSELDIALDRNASTMFASFHRDVWHLVRSLPEILHHAEAIVNLLMAYMLSPESSPEYKSQLSENRVASQKRERFIVNHATTDILHLLAVLARDLRHEIHPYVHSKILPRIFCDLLHPPLPEDGKQQVPLDVAIVEAAFRTVSYVLRYDAEALLSEGSDKEEPCLEPLRQYYGLILGSRRDIVRRLGAEAFAPLVRKLSESARKRHLKRLLRALMRHGAADSPSARRLQEDAVDGIAVFLFELARGVRGNLHSKGSLVIKSLVGVIGAETEMKGGWMLAMEAGEAFIEKLRRYLHSANMSTVFQTILSSSKAMQSVMTANPPDNGQSLIGPLRLIVKMSQCRELAADFSGLMQKLLDKNVFDSLSVESQSSVFEFCCAVWKGSPDPAYLDHHLTGRVRHMLRTCLFSSKTSNLTESYAFSGAVELLDRLPIQFALQSVGSALLSVAAGQDFSKMDSVLMITHAVVQVRERQVEIGGNDKIFDLDMARHCVVNESERNSLMSKLRKCLVCDEWTSETLARAGVAVQCLAFVTMMDPGSAASFYESVAKDILSAMTAISMRWEQHEGVLRQEISLCVSLVLESLANLLRCCFESGNAKLVERVSRKLILPATKHLLNEPSAIWVVKSFAAYVQVVQLTKLHLDLDQNMAFEKLIPNLRHTNHFMRLHTLEILTTFPPRPFIIDHADLDWTEDLDEEPSGSSQRTRVEVGSTLSRGVCQLLFDLLRVESLPLTLANEREVLSKVSGIGVLGRGGRLPVYYAEAAANHLIGLLHVKYAPLWPAVVQSFCALSKGHEKLAPPPLFETIINLMNRIPTNNERKAEAESDGALDDDLYAKYYIRRCLAWDSPCDGVIPLFDDVRRLCHEAGVIPRDQSTDEATVLEWTWRVLEKAPEMITRQPKCITPCIVRFIHEQFFLGSRDDPDAKELKLFELVGGLGPPCTMNLGKRLIHRRLVSVLQALAAVKNPRRLQNEGVTDSVYLALITHPDQVVARLAFTCVSRFKYEFLQPYEEMLFKLLEKDRIRESLLNVKTLAEEDVKASQHREQVIPILSRLLFGRLGARSGKTSKQSPSALRQAVLSFLASFCVKDEDLYPFMYLCLRAYASPDFELKVLEVQTVRDRREFIDSLMTGSPETYAKVKSSVHQGFLHMLQAVVAQFGHRVANLAPAFVTILAALIKLYEPIETERQIQVTVDDEEDSDPEDASGGRDGSIRTLCFRRLAEIFAIYHTVVDFRPFQERLLMGLKNSLIGLPAAASNSSQAPALLLLLKTISGLQPLHHLLHDNDLAVTSVIQCIDEKSRPTVMEAALAFLDNLLSHSDNDEARHAAIGSHISLILKHFGSRLNRFNILTSPWQGRTAHDRQAHEQSTWRQELAILCRISQLMKSEFSHSNADGDYTALSDLLLPFLDSVKLTENDQLNVLGILTAISSKLTVEGSQVLFTRTSALLGPGGKKTRTVSKQVYRAMAILLKMLASASYSSAAGSAQTVLELCTTHSVRIDEWDFDKVVPVLGTLGEPHGTFWIDLTRRDGLTTPAVLQPVIATCFRFLYEEDGMLSRGGFKALKSVMTTIGREMQRGDDHSNTWSKLLEGTIVVGIRNGMTVKEESVRRFYILLLADLARLSMGIKIDSPHLHSDLALLLRDDEPDLDFFLNLTHVQIHRKAKALQRLRQLINSNEGPEFYQQTVSSILIPLAIHPVYECKANLEENFATESVATVGALTRLLPWGKYSSLLGTTLNQFHRHKDQERLLVGLICSILDGFHFQVTTDTEGGSEETVVWRVLEKRFIPKLESLLVKEKLDKHGEKLQTLRPSIVLAMLKLFQKFPRSYLVRQLPRILTVICGMLKNRDSDVREQARTTLANIAVSLDISFLPDVIRELAVTLTEGYQLHVRAATLHSILLNLSLSYSVPDPDNENLYVNGFDMAVPGMIDLIQQDLFGDAQERRDAEGAHVRYVKEAMGSKSYHSLEILASLVLFKTSTTDKGHKSSVLVVVTPFLERLKELNTTVKMIRRIRECLKRIASGLSRNSSLRINEALSFIYCTIGPFILRSGSGSSGSLADLDADSEMEDEDSLRPITVSGMPNQLEVMPRESHQKLVAAWQPSLVGVATSADAARQAKLASEKHLITVKDGLNAPALTGNKRHILVFTAGSSDVNSPATISAVLFCLQLFYSTVKKVRADNATANDKLDHFVPILTTIVCSCSDMEVVLLAMKNLSLLLSFGLPSFNECSQSLCSKAIELLTTSGSARNQNNETMQCCFKMLGYLLDFERNKETSGATHKQQIPQPIDDKQMEILLSFLRVALVETEQYTPAFRLLKSIMSRTYVSSEFYDLMETLQEQTVRSSKPSLREQSSAVFVSFLLSYPMSTDRIEQHLKQAVLNIQYEHIDGRLSAIHQVSSIITKLPLEILEHHLQLFFFPLTLQLANDTSERCRAAIGATIAILLERLSDESLKTCFEYIVRWSGGNDTLLVRTSLHVFGLFTESCAGFVQKQEELHTVLDRIQSILKNSSSDWELSYFSLRALEKLLQTSNVVLQKSELWLAATSGGLSGKHPWVRRIAVRLVASYLESFPISELQKKTAQSQPFVVDVAESMHTLQNGLCRLVNLDEAEYDDEMAKNLVKALTWTIQATHCLSKKNSSGDVDRDGTVWLIKRLVLGAKSKGYKRRQTIYKCFASFASFCPDIIEPHLELIIEPLHRSEIETKNVLELPHLVHNERPLDDAVTEEAKLAKDLLYLLEQRFETNDSYTKAYSAVKFRFQEKREKRKIEMKTEAVVDPEVSAKRKIQKHEREKRRQKRRVDERRSLRGGTAKRKH